LTKNEKNLKITKNRKNKKQNKNRNRHKTKIKTETKTETKTVFNFSYAKGTIFYCTYRDKKLKRLVGLK
jgi:hypothetical protein